MPQKPERTGYIRTESREGARYATGSVQTEYVVL